MNNISEYSTGYLIDKVCGGIDNIDEPSLIGNYVAINLRDGSKFYARALEGTGVYAFKYDMRYNLRGTLILLIPECSDAELFKYYIDKALKVRDKTYDEYI